MPRPKNNRYVFEPPMFREFKPVGVAARSLRINRLTLDEYESIRLADHQGLSHEESADEMGISRSTFSRLVVGARKKVSDSLVNGKMLLIEGGNIHFRNNIIRCMNCGNIFKIKIGTVLTKCPECGSTNLQNLAGGFGHGRCCANY